MKPNASIVKFGIKIKKHLLKFEILTLLIFVLFLVLNSKGDYSTHVILTPLGLTLSLLYFLLSFATKKDNIKEFFFNQILYYNLSILVIGILFVSTSLPGGYIMLTVGSICLTLTMTIGLGLRKKLSLEKSINKPIILKCVILLSIALMLKFAPAESLRSINIFPEIDTYSTSQTQDSSTNTIEIDTLSTAQIQDSSVVTENKDL